MAANLRTDWVSLAPGKDAPGPGSYNVMEAARIEAKRPPAFSMGGQVCWTRRGVRGDEG